MRLNRFFTERINVRVGSSVKLSENDNKHIKSVLRLEKGDKIILFNGEKEFEAVLRLVSKDVVMAEITEVLRVEDFSEESGVEITLIQALLKAGKFDTIIEKTTELGIDLVIPLECEYSQSKLQNATEKIERWNRVMLSASKQSERVKIPEVIQPMKFSDLQNVVVEFDIVYFFTIPRDSVESSNLAEKLTKESSKKVSKIAFLIGPEGGFSPQEHALAQTWGFKFVKFGKTILRSETAAVAATAILQYIYNDK